MNKTSLVMVQEIRNTLRRKAFMIIGFGVPIVMGIVALIIGFVNRDAATDLMATALQEATNPVAKVEGFIDEGDLVQFIPESDSFAKLVEYPDRNAAQKAMNAEEISAYYIIDSDYVESGDITYVKPSHNPIADNLNTRHLEWLLVANLLGDTELAEKVWNPINVTFTAQDPQLDENEDSWVVELLPNMMSFALYMVIIMSSGVMIAAVTDEKKNRVMEVLLSSVSTDQLIAGKIIAVGVLGLFIIAAWLIVFWAIAKFGGQALSIPQGFTLPTNLLVWSIVFALFGYAIYGAQMAGVGALVPDIKDSRSITFIVLAPLILVYVFLVAIVANPNGLIAVILSFFPLTSPIAMVARMAATDIPWWQSLIAAILQLAAIIFIIRLVARLFHAQTLLSGQSVSAKQYYKVLMGR